MTGTSARADRTASNDLFARVGAVAQRLLVEQGVRTVDDLHPDLSLTVLKSAWWEVLSEGAADPDDACFRRATEAWVEFLLAIPPASQPV